MKISSTIFRNHIVTILVTFSAWFGALLVGLPTDYFLQCSFNEQLLISVLTIPFTMILSYFLLVYFWKENWIKSSLWIAFYASGPLYIYDYIYLGVIQNLGHSWYLDYWFLTIGYFWVWLVIPIVGLSLQSRKVHSNTEIH